MSDVWRRREDGGLEVVVHAVPGAGRSQVVGRHGDALKIRVAAPAEDGRANRAILDLLATMLGVGSGALTLTSGGGSRTKRVRVDPASAAQAEALLREVLG